MPLKSLRVQEAVSLNTNLQTIMRWFILSSHVEKNNQASSLQNATNKQYKKTNKQALTIETFCTLSETSSLKVVDAKQLK